LRSRLQMKERCLLKTTGSQSTPNLHFRLRQIFAPSNLLRTLARPTHR
jgi:hypothetical protein